MTDVPARPFRIYLLRHAHAAWPASGMRDFDRPLDARGREEATRIAAMMALNGYEPERIVCSPATRCAQTLEIVTRKIGRDADTVFAPELYAAKVAIYLGAIEAAAHAGAKSLLIVGHNPTIEETAHRLLSLQDGVSDAILGNGFPTAGLLIIDSQSPALPAIQGHGQFAGLLSPIDA